MAARLLFRCYHEAATSLVASGSLTQRLKRADESLTQLSVHVDRLPQELLERVRDIYSRTTIVDVLSETEQERLASDILATYVQVCVRTVAQEWISGPENGSR